MSEVRQLMLNSLNKQIAAKSLGSGLVGGAYAGGKKKLSAWNRHVSAIYDKNPDLSFSEVIKMAKKSYKKPARKQAKKASKAKKIVKELVSEMPGSSADKVSALEKHQNELGMELKKIEKELRNHEALDDRRYKFLSDRMKVLIELIYEIDAAIADSLYGSDEQKQKRYDMYDGDMKRIFAKLDMPEEYEQDEYEDYGPEDDEAYGYEFRGDGILKKTLKSRLGRVKKDVCKSRVKKKSALEKLLRKVAKDALGKKKRKAKKGKGLVGGYSDASAIRQLMLAKLR